MPDKTHHHITPVKTYVVIGVSLLFLTVITVLVAQIDFGALNTLIAITIATVKALLVALFFMGLKYDLKLFSVFLVVSLAMVLLFISISVIDTFTRTEIYDYQMKEIEKDAIIYRKPSK